MQALKRASAVALISAGLAPATLAATTHAAARHPGCAKTYTLAMFKRAALRVYAGSGLPPKGSYGHLHHYAHCQRTASDRGRAAAFWAAQIIAWAQRRAPAMTGPVLASWYEDAGSTACGFHATYGFASLFLPCGATIDMAGPSGRVVTATMQDRGPYVAGRTFDLNAALKAALGCGDLCEVTYRVR